MKLRDYQIECLEIIDKLDEDSRVSFNNIAEERDNNSVRTTSAGVIALVSSLTALYSGAMIAGCVAGEKIEENSRDM